MMLIAAEGLTIRLGGAMILDQVDFAIDAGEIVTLVGPNGSGKTTLVRALLGMLPLSSGMVRRRQGLRIGYVPQKIQIDQSLPISVSRFLDLPHRQNRQKRRQVLEQAGALSLENHQLASLSGGQFQRVLLARALLDSPQLLVLDEAAQGLDQAGTAAFYRQIEEVRDRYGCAVLMVSHELHVVMRASDRVICLNGHICCQGTPQVVASAPQYRQLFGTGTAGALALYQHHHSHVHHHDDNDAGHNHDKGGENQHDHAG